MHSSLNQQLRRTLHVGKFEPPVVVVVELEHTVKLEAEGDSLRRPECACHKTLPLAQWTRADTILTCAALPCGWICTFDWTSQSKIQHRMSAPELMMTVTLLNGLLELGVCRQFSCLFTFLNGVCLIFLQLLMLSFLLEEGRVQCLIRIRLVNGGMIARKTIPVHS